MIETINVLFNHPYIMLLVETPILCTEIYLCSNKISTNLNT